MIEEYLYANNIWWDKSQLTIIEKINVSSTLIQINNNYILLWIKLIINWKSLSSKVTPKGGECVCFKILLNRELRFLTQIKPTRYKG